MLAVFIVIIIHHNSFPTYLRYNIYQLFKHNGPNIQYHLPLNCFHAHNWTQNWYGELHSAPGSPGCFALHSATLLWLNTALFCTRHHSGNAVQHNSAEALKLSSIVTVFLKTRCLGQMYWRHRNASYFVIFDTIIVIILITGISFAIFIEVFLARVRQQGAVILAKRNNQYITLALCQNDLPGQKSKI